MIFLSILCALAFLEIGLIVTVRHFRREFQWLITEKDECPHLDPGKLQGFVQNSFDPLLGWVRKPSTSGTEKGRSKSVQYAIDSIGARAAPSHGVGPPAIAAFGDSYTFCRQVNDDETWEVMLAEKCNVGVLNFGVGNYGADQAILRYEATPLPDSVKVVLLGFVPETICRVQSCWKHYLEFGNTFGFKPRFAWSNAQLVLCPNPMQSAEDFCALQGKLEQIRKTDGLYRTKFRSMQFRIPYSLSFARHPVRNALLLQRLIIRRIFRLLGRVSPATEDGPFALVMDANIRFAHRMYADSDACDLLRAILLRFRSEAVRRGHQPVVLVMPQLLDLRVSAKRAPPYATFFAQVAREIPTIDLTNALLNLAPGDLHRLYTEDVYGGHFSKDGNSFIAAYLARELSNLVPSILCPGS